MTDRALMAALVNAVERLSQDVETLGCTCANGEENKFHAPSRRRRDSRCSGVRLAVTYRGLTRRAHRRLAQRFTHEGETL